jgi:hypothetical protein
MSDDIVEALADPPGFPAVTQQYAPVPLLATVMDIGPLRSKDVNVPGVYVAVCRDDRIRKWGGAILFAKKNPDSSEFMALSRIMNEADMGYTEDILGDGPVGYWDMVSIINVVMISGTLESRDEMDVLNGANWACVGDEIIAYQNAELVDENTYEISGLLRGLRNTEDQVAIHPGNERFVPLSRALIQFVPFDVKDIGVPFVCKVISGGGDPDDAAEIALTPLGSTLTPFSPVDILAEYVGPDLVISWTRRSREVMRLFSMNPAPLLEEEESYEIDLSTGGTHLRTGTEDPAPPLRVSGAASRAYTAAEQAADGYIPGDPLTITVYQTSATVGRGKGTTITI